MDSFSSQFLAVATEWKNQFHVIEPVIQQLVQCYDYSAHVVRSRQSDVAPRLLNELWDELVDEFPSELDVRAAAVRLFSFDSRIPEWLESKIARDEQPNAPGHSLNFAFVDITKTMQATLEAPAVAQSLRQLHELVADEMRGLCELTAKLEEMLAEEANEPVPAALDMTLESLANVRADDIRAAAVRLGIATESNLAW
jgi:hypothetical protein